MNLKLIHPAKACKNQTTSLHNKLFVLGNMKWIVLKQSCLGKKKRLPTESDFLNKIKYYKAILLNSVRKVLILLLWHGSHGSP